MEKWTYLPKQSAVTEWIIGQCVNTERGILPKNSPKTQQIENTATFLVDFPATYNFKYFQLHIYSYIFMILVTIWNRNETKLECVTFYLLENFL